MVAAEKDSDYPAWLYFFPMYIVLAGYALLGRTGYVLVADAWITFPASEIILYYVLTYGVYFPLIFIGQWVYYRLLSRRFGIYWKDFSRYDKIAIITYDVVGFVLFLWVEQIFGVNGPYNTSLDFQIGWMYVWFGDFLFFFIAGPLLMIGFHGINFAICHKRKDNRKFQFFFVVLGISVIGTITQDWWWWISAPDINWGPEITIYYYFSGWIQVPFTELYIPVVYFNVAVISLIILFLSTIKTYKIKDYILWCLVPYLIFVKIGTILLYAL